MPDYLIPTMVPASSLHCLASHHVAKALTQNLDQPKVEFSPEIVYSSLHANEMWLPHNGLTYNEYIRQHNTPSLNMFHLNTRSEKFQSHKNNWNHSSVQDEYLIRDDISDSSSQEPNNEQSTNSDCSDQFDEDGNKVSQKRTRKGISLKQKTEVINYFEENRCMSLQVIGDYFQLSRTTISGIIKNKEAIINRYEQTQRGSRILDSCRMVEAPFYILEEVLSAWYKHLRKRGFVITCKKVSAQAIEIHRTLSDTLQSPLPPCTFSSGWLKGFRKRTGFTCYSDRIEPTTYELEKWNIKKILWGLETYSLDDIYTCDISTMFLSPLPVATFNNKDQPATDSSSASVLLCCNASGLHKLKPLVLAQQTPPNIKLESHGGYQTNELNCTQFEQWLLEFDSIVGRKVMLLVDQSIWSMLTFKWEEFGLRNIHFVNVPSFLCVSQPMRTTIVKEFKNFYHALLLENITTMTQPSPKKELPNNSPFKQSPTTPTLAHASETRLSLIPEAWDCVSPLTITHSFKRFMDEAGLPQCKDLKIMKLYGENNSAETRLNSALNSGIYHDNIWAIRYYQNHDIDIGPTSFIHKQIISLQQHPSFQRYFKYPSLGCTNSGEIQQLDKCESAPTIQKRKLDQHAFTPNLLSP